MVRYVGPDGQIHYLGDPFELQHHGVLGMKWGVRRYQPYPKGHTGGKEVGKAKKVKQRVKVDTKGSYNPGKNASAKSKHLAKKADKARSKTESLRIQRNDAWRNKQDSSKIEKKFVKAENRESSISDKLSNSIRNDNEKVSKWQEREIERIDKKYSKDINRSEKYAADCLSKFEKTKKDGWAKSYVEWKYEAYKSRGMADVEKHFVKNATMSDIKKERRVVTAGQAAILGGSAALSVATIGFGLPFGVLVSASAAGLKTTRRTNGYDEKIAKSAESKTRRQLSNDIKNKSYSKDIQKRLDEERRRRYEMHRQAVNSASIAMYGFPMM